MNRPTQPVKTMIRLLDDYAIVPSSTGRGCYHVAFEDGVSVHCTCPDHARRSRVCKHMTAVDAALKGQAVRARGRDCYEVDLIPQTRKPAAKPAPSLASLYCAKPAPTWTDAQTRALETRFSEFEAAR